MSMVVGGIYNITSNCSILISMMMCSSDVTSSTSTTSGEKKDTIVTLKRT